jgi:hypothetical protein
VVERAAHADPVRIAAGEECRTRGRADGLPDVEAREPRALAGEPVDVRRADARGTEAADVGIPEIVGEDDDDVRRPAIVGPGERQRCTQQPAHDEQTDHRMHWTPFRSMWHSGRSYAA